MMESVASESKSAGVLMDSNDEIMLLLFSSQTVSFRLPSFPRRLQLLCCFDEKVSRSSSLSEAISSP
uniref:Ovule protein n=1 Tax=Strongyloides venezuelensis TaxID=75913 RepID=A0A0K0FFG8_STRVS